MIVKPYASPPTAPLVALLLPDQTIVGENGDALNLDDWPPEYRLWCSYETAWTLVRDGHGEALCWNNEENKWRHEQPEIDGDGWKHRPTDASVIKAAFSHLPVETQLEGFAQWRDWLAEHGASAGTSVSARTCGSASMSLLKSQLRRPLVCSYPGPKVTPGARPPLRSTVGGRQETGPRGPGSYEGNILHLDMPSAYASTLASLRYGGIWRRYHDVRIDRIPDDLCVFVRARVRIPTGNYGPLVQRHRVPPNIAASYQAQLLGLSSSYPKERKVLQGVWTLQELQAAEDHGTVVLKVIDVWVHSAGSLPFESWWRAVQQGRALRNPLAAELAKMTGNALWGRFCMDFASGGRRTIRSSVKPGQLVGRALPSFGGQLPAHDLAEAVSGRVRARLYDMAETLGERLLSAHTDGVWLDGTGMSPSETKDLATRSGWRIKNFATRIDLLGPQALRYELRGAGDEWRYTYAGVPQERQAEFFEQRWKEEQLAT